MNTIDNNYLCSLFSIYEKLFTIKQKEYFTYYHIENLTLLEISEIMNISKAAVQDAIKKIEAKLHDYEKKLNIYQKSKDLKNKLTKFKKNNNYEIIDEIIKNI